MKGQYPFSLNIVKIPKMEHFIPEIFHSSVLGRGWLGSGPQGQGVGAEPRWGPMRGSPEIPMNSSIDGGGIVLSMYPINSVDRSLVSLHIHPAPGKD